MHPVVALLLLLCSAASSAAARRARVHYIAIDPVRWDYYPTHAANRSLNAGPAGDRCTAAAFEDDQLLFVGDGRALDDGFVPSSVYDKLVFREYTDAAFTHRIPRRRADRHLGLLGPLLRVAAGEALVVYVRGPPENVAEGPVFGFEVDGLVGTPSRVVRPGEVATFRYKVDYTSAPAKRAFVDSHLLLYRGTVGDGPDGSAGIYKGLLGGVIVYKRGLLRPDGTPKGIHNELVTILWVANENTGGEEGDVEESNLMHGINGMLYCSLPDLHMVEGKRMRWYFGAVGNEVDVHTAHMHGVVGTNAGGQHMDSIRLLPGTTASLEIVPDSVGTWLMHCHINDHLHAGMQVLYTVHRNKHARKPLPSPRPRKRVYYVQAEDDVWEYAPKGRNVCDDTEYGDDETIFVQSHFPIDLEEGGEGYGIGSAYVKSRYFEYTDNTFTERVVRDESMNHLGIMGPVLRARVGEEIVIHFRNRASEAVSVHPHGVLYNKRNEGAPYNDGSSARAKEDDRIVPGGEFTYRWEVPERAGPGPGERQETKLWMYHSHRSEIQDTYAGLFGAIVIIGREGKYDDETLLPADGTKEVFLHMSVMNEGGSFHLMENVLRDEGNRNLTEEQREGLLGNEEFEESNLMHSINGYLYCNGPIVKLQKGKKTRFYFYALGTEVDLHTPMIGKEALDLDVGSTVGSGALLAGTFASALVTPAHAGLNELRCNVNDHVVAGMRALYYVEESGEAPVAQKPDVVHYMAADVVDWDYAPLGVDGCTGAAFGDDEKVFTEPGEFTPGSRYAKAVYREYTNESFTHAMPTAGFNGVSGPVLHFEVGEVAKIVFRNNLPFPANLHVVGLTLVHPKENKAVPPGGKVTYTLRAGEPAAPGRWDGSSVAYVYYSSVDAITHIHAGLVGVSAIVRAGKLGADRLPSGVMAAHPLLMNIFRENESPLLEQSLQQYAPGGVGREEELGEDEDWLESNAMHAINGYLYGNNPRLQVPQGGSVRFYVFGFGSKASMHAPVFKRQIAHRRTKSGVDSDGVQILPFNARSVDVSFVTAGVSEIICGVADHVLGGMKVCVDVV